MSEWIRCDERLPEKEGVYLVTLLNREWNRDRSGIEEGLKPPHDKYWEQHKDLYGQLPDGRCVKVEQRVFHDGIWSGYMETVLAWMQMPRPYEVEEQLQLDPTVDANHIADDGKKVDVVQVVRCQDCKWWDKKDDAPYGYCMAMKHGFVSSHWEIGIYRTYKGDFFCADGERREEDE